MGTVFKHTLRSMRAHIVQPIVIVFTVAVVTMLFFASSVIGSLFYNFQYANASRVAGNADVSVSGKFFSGARFDEFVREKEDDIEYVEKFLSSVGIINGAEGSGEDSTGVLIEATDLKTYVERNKSKFFYSRGIKDVDYSAPGILISEDLASIIGCDVGDEVEIYVGFYARYATFTVTYIFENKGFFGNTTVYNVLTDLSALGDKGLYTEAYIKLNEGVNSEKFVSDLAAYMDNDELKIGSAVDYAYIERIVADNQNLLRIALVFVVALVLFILFGAYTVVTKKRAEEMLVFKAVGASPTQMLTVLLAEVVFYGAIGGIIGTVFGRFGMEVAVKSVIPEFGGAVVYKAWNYVLALLLGIVVSVAGSVIPVVRLIGNSVRHQSAEGAKSVKKVHPAFIAIPLAIFALSAAGVALIKSFELPFTVILIISAAVALVLGAPYIMKLVSAVFGWGKGICRLSSMGIKRNSEAVSLSCLLGAVMAFTFITAGIVGVIIDASEPVNSRFHADYAVQSATGRTDYEKVNETLKNTFGVEETFLLYYDKNDVVINGRETDITVYAVNSSADLACVCDLTQKEREKFDNEETAAVVGYDLLARFGKKEGDKITVFVGGKDRIFTVIATDKKKTANDRVIFLNKAGCEFGFDDAHVFVNISDNVSHSDLYAELKEKLSENGCFIFEFDKWAYASTVGVFGLALLLRLLQIIVGLVGIVGIVNMTVSMMMARERELGVFRASGMDEKRYGLLLLGESAQISITGAIIGSVIAISVNTLIPTFARMIDRYVGADIGWIIPIIAAAMIVTYGVIYITVGSRFKIKKTEINKNSI